MVSHDRHFLNNVCTHIVDVDYNKIKIYVGNYDFWYESSQLMQRMIRRTRTRKAEDKIKELQSFIERFSANKSKSRQATSRKKLLEKLTVEEMPASSRRYPFVGFQMDREAGQGYPHRWSDLSKTVDGVKVLRRRLLSASAGETRSPLSVKTRSRQTTLFQILAGEMEPDEGSFKWGVSTSPVLFPKGQHRLFSTGCDLNHPPVAAPSMPPTPPRPICAAFWAECSFPATMCYKPVKVLSGGEKVALYAFPDDDVRLQRADAGPADEPPGPWNPSPRSTTDLA